MAPDSNAIAKLEQVWQSIDKLCESFTELEWKLPTHCPGWSETFACLVFGRWEPDKVLESGRVLFAGDRQLEYRIVRHMAVTP